jgi:hypothetical protein
VLGRAVVRVSAKFTPQLGDLSFDLSGPFGAIHHGF